MAKILATFEDKSLGGAKKFDVMLTTVQPDERVYIRRSGTNTEIAWISIDVDDIDDLVTVLQYAKKIIVDDSWEPKPDMDWISADG